MLLNITLTNISYACLIEHDKIEWTWKEKLENVTKISRSSIVYVRIEDLETILNGRDIGTWFFFIKPWYIDNKTITIARGVGFFRSNVPKEFWSSIGTPRSLPTNYEKSFEYNIGNFSSSRVAVLELPPRGPPAYNCKIYYDKITGIMLEVFPYIERSKIRGAQFTLKGKYWAGVLRANVLYYALNVSAIAPNTPPVTDITYSLKIYKTNINFERPVIDEVTENKYSYLWQVSIIISIVITTMILLTLFLKKLGELSVKSMRILQLYGIILILMALTLLVNINTISGVAKSHYIRYSPMPGRYISVLLIWRRCC